MCRGAPAEDHVLGDLAAHDRHRHDLRRPGLAVAGGWRCRRRRTGRRAAGRRRRALIEEAENVVLGDAAGDAGTGDLAQVHAVLLGDPADQRRRFLAQIATLTGGRRFGARGGGSPGRGYLGRRRARRRRCGGSGGGARRTWRRGRRTVRLRRGWRGLARRRSGLGRRRGRRRRGRLLARRANRGDDAVDRDRFAFLDADLEQRARRRRRNLGVHLVGGNLEQRLVAIDAVADLLDPADDRALGDRLAHLRHYDWCRHDRILGSPPRCESPRRARRAPLHPPPRSSSDGRGSSSPAPRPCIPAAAPRPLRR